MTATKSFRGTAVKDDRACTYYVQAHRMRWKKSPLPWRYGTRSLLTRAKASTALSKSSTVCAALIWVRMRALP